MTLALSWAPLAPVVGELAEITLSIDDLDGRPQQVLMYFGEGEGGLFQFDLCTVPIVPHHSTPVFRHRFLGAGTKTIRAIVQTGLCMSTLAEEREVEAQVTVLPAH